MNESPDIYNIIYNQGVVNLNNTNNTITGSFNNSDINNSSIQSDNSFGIEVPQEHLDSLQGEIKGIEDNIVKSMNEEWFYNFQSSLKEHDKEQAKKYLNFIKKAIGSVPSILALGQYIE